MTEKRGGTASNVQLFDDLFRAQVAGDQLDLLFETLQVGESAAPVLGDDLVATAVVAGVGTEWQMHVQRQRMHGQAAAAQRVKEVEGSDLVVELGRCRIRRITRANLIVTTDQVGIPANGVEHVVFPVMTAVAGF